MSQVSKKINKYLRQRFEKDIKRLLFVLSCEHAFEKYGHGYKCLECDHYTGSNETENWIIEKGVRPTLNNPTEKQV